MAGRMGEAAEATTGDSWSWGGPATDGDNMLLVGGREDDATTLYAGGETTSSSQATSSRACSSGEGADRTTFRPDVAATP